MTMGSKQLDARREHVKTLALLARLIILAPARVPFRRLFFVLTANPS